MAFIDDCVTILADAGLGVRGVSLFWTSGAVLPITSAPAAQTGFYTLRSTGGTSPILMHTSEQTPGYLRPSLQLTARAKGATAASFKAQQAWTLFAKDPDTGKPRRDFFVNSCWYVSLDVVQSEPFDLGPDAAGLLRFEFNMKAVKRPM